ncbi:helicase domino, partial [Cydia fagiglandana]|uniref:helicase domino n=1 Tax=Cydia fagiglandana TaxID=1458189 RepID=UPI002FEDF6F6
MSGRSRDERATAAPAAVAAAVPPLMGVERVVGVLPAGGGGGGGAEALNGAAAPPERAPDEPPRKRTKLDEAPSLRKRVLEYKLLRLKTLRDRYTEQLSELYFLQAGGNMMDYAAWRKRPPAPQLAAFLEARRPPPVPPPEPPAPDPPPPTEMVEKARQEAYVAARVAELARAGLWAERRLPRVCEPPRPKTHWDYLLEEMAWLAQDFAHERKWKKQAAKKCARAVQKYFQDKAAAAQKAEKAQELQLKRIAAFAAKEIRTFWLNVEKLVEWKRSRRVERARKEALDEQLSIIVDRTEQYSRQLAASLQPQPDTPPSDDEFTPRGPDSDDEETIAQAEQEAQHDASHHRDEIEALRRESRLALPDLLPPGYTPAAPSPPPSPGSSDYSGDADSADDEDTIAEQERRERTDHKQEIDELQEEADLDIEELRRRYAAAPPPPPPEHVESEREESESEHSDESDASSSASSSASGGSEKLATLVDDPGAGSERRVEAAASLAATLQPTGTTLQSTAVATPVPRLLKHPLREYQHVGLHWLATMHARALNGILADEMGLGKTIQTIALLAHLALERQDWGPHLVVAPTSVVLNWEMEFKKWCPAFKILTYYGTIKERKLKRVGWTKPNSFHVCITSYKLVVQDHQSFRRKRWRYLVLDEAQNIKNFKSQRWQMLLNFQTDRRLLLTGTPLQNSLLELWSLMHFLMPDVFASHSEFREWFAPVAALAGEGGAGAGTAGLVRRLHEVLRPFLLRRLKADVERQMPRKYEHVLLCRLAKRQRCLYDDFMARAKTKESLASGNLLSVINVLMQLRKVCNHPDLFEPRAVASPFHMDALRIHVPAVVLLEEVGILYNTPTCSSRAPSPRPSTWTRCGYTCPPSYCWRRWVFCTTPRPVRAARRRLALPHGRAADTRARRRTTGGGGYSVQHPDLFEPRAVASPFHMDALRIHVPAVVLLEEVGILYNTPTCSSRAPSPRPSTWTRCGYTCPPSYCWRRWVFCTTPRPVRAARRRLALPHGRAADTRARRRTAGGGGYSVQHPDLFEPRAIASPFHMDALRIHVPAVVLLEEVRERIACAARLGGDLATLEASEAGAFAAHRARHLAPPRRMVEELCAAPPPAAPRPPEAKLRIHLRLVPRALPPAALGAATAPPLRVRTARRGRGAAAARAPAPPGAGAGAAARLEARRLACLRRLAAANERRCWRLPLLGADLRRAVRAPPSPPPERLRPPRLAELLERMHDLVDRFSVCWRSCVATTPTLEAGAGRGARDWRRAARAAERAAAAPARAALALLHAAASRQTVAFPHPRLLQFDCGKLQALAPLLRRLKAGGHRVLIFTQMTRVLDVLEAFLSLHGHAYARLDGATKVERRQALVERFNADARLFAFILSTRSGGVGLNLTGADCVIFYDSDWNPTMDAQAQDRCHRIGQTRDVHVFRLVTQATVEENILRKATEKRRLGELAIDDGHFTTSYLREASIKELFGSGADVAAGGDVESALAAAEDEQDAAAARAARAEQQGELAEFDEAVPLRDDDHPDHKDELATLMSQVHTPRPAPPRAEQQGELAEFDEAVPLRDDDHPDHKDELATLMSQVHTPRPAPPRAEQQGELAEFDEAVPLRDDDHPDHKDELATLMSQVHTPRPAPPRAEQQGELAEFDEAVPLRDDDHPDHKDELATLMSQVHTPRPAPPRPAPSSRASWPSTHPPPRPAPPRAEQQGELAEFDEAVPLRDDDHPDHKDELATLMSQVHTPRPAPPRPAPSSRASWPSTHPPPRPAPRRAEQQGELAEFDEAVPLRDDDHPDHKDELATLMSQVHTPRPAPPRPAPSSRASWPSTHPPPRPAPPRAEQQGELAEFDEAVPLRDDDHPDHKDELATLMSQQGELAEFDEAVPLRDDDHPDHKDELATLMSQVHTPRAEQQGELAEFDEAVPLRDDDHPDHKDELATLMSQVHTPRAEQQGELAEFDEAVPLRDDDHPDHKDELATLMSQLTPIEKYAMRCVESSEAGCEAEREALSAVRRSLGDWERRRRRDAEPEPEPEPEPADAEPELTYSRRDADTKVRPRRRAAPPPSPPPSPRPARAAGDDTKDTKDTLDAKEKTDAKESAAAKAGTRATRSRGGVQIDLWRLDARRGRRSDRAERPALRNGTLDAWLVWLSGGPARGGARAERMPIWCPPSPPASDGDGELYRPPWARALYRAGPAPEHALPALPRARAGGGAARAGPPAPPLPHAHPRPPRPPRAPPSLFERGARVRVRPRAPADKHKDAPAPDWAPAEDAALRRALRLQRLPPDAPPARAPNWEWAAELVADVARAYRAPRACRDRHERLAAPDDRDRDRPDRERDRQDRHQRRKQRKPGARRRVDDDAPRPPLARLDAMREAAERRRAAPKRRLDDAQHHNPKHAQLLADHGLDYDRPPTPMEVASRRADRIAKEKSKAAGAGPCGAPAPAA